MQRFKAPFIFLLTCVLLWTQGALAVAPVVVAQSKVARCACCQNVRMECCPAPAAPAVPTVPTAAPQTESSREVTPPDATKEVLFSLVFASDEASSPAPVSLTAPALPVPPAYERLCSYLI